MKKLILPLILIIGTLGIFAFADDPKDRKIGADAPMLDYSMKGVDGKSQSLKSLAGDKGLLVVFSCNTCPFVVAWEDRYNVLHKLAEENGVGMVLINSNEAKREGDDSMSEMKKHAKDQKYLSPYLVDEKSALADAFGARTTPHVFLFDNNMKLVYRGAIDDNYKNKESVSETFLMDAIKNLSAGKTISPDVTKATGCSIKRV